ncbi:MAG TPA: DCC1-like thiol-disulfide oxidoreductase family protein [Myxococcaceae bacterium]|nr:DCC1-like thiol-disulfide oxidoreductase family protein [Myxococcaceae bacterium]
MDASDSDILFYDGGCGLCHRAVRFVLARDPAGRFRFAPLGGSATVGPGWGGFYAPSPAHCTIRAMMS